MVRAATKRDSWGESRRKVVLKAWDKKCSLENSSQRGQRAFERKAPMIHVACPCMFQTACIAIRLTQDATYAPRRQRRLCRQRFVVT